MQEHGELQMLNEITINNGNFVQGYDFSVIQNSGQMDINGGTFVGSENGNSLITNNKGTESGNVTLNITNGDFKSNLILYNGDNSNVSISGGTYQNPESVVAYLLEGLIIDEDGTVVKPISEPSKEENNPNTSDINLYLLLSLIAASGLGISYTVKKRFN